MQPLEGKRASQKAGFLCPISSKILVNIEGKRKEKKYKKVKKEEKRREEKAKVALLVVILATLGSMHLVVTYKKNTAGYICSISSC